MSGAKSNMGRKKTHPSIQKENCERSVALLKSIKNQSGLSWERLEKLCGLSRGTLSRYSRGQRVLGDVLYKRVVMTYLTKIAAPRDLKEQTLDVVYLPMIKSLAEDFVAAVGVEREALELKQILERLDFENQVSKDLADLQELTDEFWQRLKTLK